MSFAAVKQYFESVGLGANVLLLEKPSATVAQAAEALGAKKSKLRKPCLFLWIISLFSLLLQGTRKLIIKNLRANFTKKQT